MSRTFRLTHARRVGILLASGLACAAVPAVASASAVNLGTASPFVVLGASSVTNTDLPRLPVISVWRREIP